VQHLAGFLVALVVVLRSQPPSQQPERALGHPRDERERLERRDQAVAPEQRREPGQAGGVIGVAVELGAEQLEVVERALEDPVEELVVGGDGRALLVARAPRYDGRQPAVEVLRHLEVERDVDGAPGFEVELEHQLAVAAHPRLRARRHAGRAAHAVAAHEREAALVAIRRRPVVRRHDPAQLQHGHEVGAHGDLERQPQRAAVIAPDSDPLPQRAAGLRAPLDPDPEALRGQPLAALQHQVGVGELVHRFRARSVRGGEEARQLAAHAQLVAA
jgi:hypothetical protein